MTTLVQIIHPHPHAGHNIVLSDTAKGHIRHNFNPSGLKEVNNLKALSGAFITYVEQLKEIHPHAARELSVAITEIQTASMWAVLGATKGK